MGERWGTCAEWRHGGQREWMEGWGGRGLSKKLALTRGREGLHSRPNQARPSYPPSPGTSRPRSPSLKSSSYLMTLSCLGALHESPMLVSDLASARKFMGWPGTGGEAHTRGGLEDEVGLEPHQPPDPPRELRAQTRLPPLPAQLRCPFRHRSHSPGRLSPGTTCPLFSSSREGRCLDVPAPL